MKWVLLLALLYSLYKIVTDIGEIEDHVEETKKAILKYI